MKKSIKYSIELVCLLLIIVLCKVLWIQFVYIESNTTPAYSNEPFRIALSISPFTETAFVDGYTYELHGQHISDTTALQKAYIEYGATEMYTRIATKRHITAENITHGEPDSNANIHTFDQAIARASIAAKLGIPLNPEIMLAYTYMDMEKQQAPDFSEYPEIYALQNGKDWSVLTLEEMIIVLRAYAKFVATEILKTGCTVNNWNIGNEANFGFAGVAIGLKTAVNPKLEHISSVMRYILPTFNTRWLEQNLWKYNAQQMVAVKSGILDAYEELMLSAAHVKFSTHIATVIMPPRSSAHYFNILKKYGYAVDTAGISVYPSAPSLFINTIILYKKTLTAINRQAGLPVFIAEFAYPSGAMSGPFAGWNKKTNGYAMTEAGQAAIYKDIVQ